MINVSLILEWDLFILLNLFTFAFWHLTLSNHYFVGIQLVIMSLRSHFGMGPISH
jgi:hypothetical protein